LDRSHAHYELCARSGHGGQIEPRAMTPAEFGKFIDDEIEKWAKVIKFTDIKAQ
jgi:tripartite-type tricarboxylate transporter receptor subunit TctC